MWQRPAALLDRQTSKYEKNTDLKRISFKVSQPQSEFEPSFAVWPQLLEGSPGAAQPLQGSLHRCRARRVGIARRSAMFIMNVNKYTSSHVSTIVMY